MPEPLNRLNSLLAKPPGIKALLFAIIICGLVMMWRILTVNPAPCTGHGDCVKYTIMSEGFKNGNYPAIEQPFNTRVLTPFLASKLPGSTTDNFTAITFASFTAFIAAWYFIARKLHLPLHAFGFFILWFIVHPLGFNIYYTYRELVDPTSYALMAIAVYFYLAKRHGLFLLTIFIALLGKESFLFILLVAVVGELCSAWRARQKLMEACMFSALALMVFLAFQASMKFSQQVFFPPSDHVTISETIRFWWRLVRHDPNRLIVWAGSFFCATGTLIALLSAKRDRSLSDEEFRQSLFLKLGACGFVVLGLIGGADMSRIIFNGIVFICLAMFLRINDSITHHRVFVCYISSILVALIYPMFFNTTFEYTYYFSKEIAGTLAFAASLALLVLAIRRTYPA